MQCASFRAAGGNDPTGVSVSATGAATATAGAPAADAAPQPQFSAAMLEAMAMDPVIKKNLFFGNENELIHCWVETEMEDFPKKLWQASGRV